MFAAACQTSHYASPAGAELLWGGKPLQDHTIPECYGAVQPTAVFVPLQAMRDPEVFKLVTTEVFGPFQVITEYTGGQGGGALYAVSGVPQPAKDSTAAAAH